MIMLVLFKAILQSLCQTVQNHLNVCDTLHLPHFGILMVKLDL